VTSNCVHSNVVGQVSYSYIFRYISYAIVERHTRCNVTCFADVASNVCLLSWQQ